MVCRKCVGSVLDINICEESEESRAGQRDTADSGSSSGVGNPFMVVLLGEKGSGHL